MPIDIEQKRREEARWRILRMLYAGQPIGCSEELLCRGLDDIKIPFTMNDVRRELEYLRDRELVTIESEDHEAWFGKLTWHGVDFVEYTIPAEPGIARPRR